MGLRVAELWLATRGFEMFDKHASNTERKRHLDGALILLVAATGLLVFWSAVLFGLLQVI